MIVGVGLIVFLLYQLLGDPRPDMRSEVIDLTQATEQIQELSTVRSHLRFGVVVREEGGNIIVRRLIDQGERIGMDNLSSVLFQDPTVIMELHGVATYGIRLGDLASRVEQNDSIVRVDLPDAEVLDVKLIAADTRLVAKMKGLFRSSNDELTLEANRQGEQFVREYAAQDTTLLALAEARARDLISLLVQQGEKRATFE